METEETRMCIKCEQERPPFMFYYRKRVTGGVYDSICKICLGHDPNRIIEHKNRKELFAQGLIQCSKCKQAKELDCFCRNSSYWTGHCTICKECQQSPRVKERKELFAQGKKRCSTCGEVKSLNDFHHVPADWRNPSGRESACRECSNKQRQEAMKRPHRKRNHQAATARVRANRQKAPGQYTGEDIERQYELQNGLCSYRVLNPNCLVNLSYDTHGYEVDHVIPLSREGTNDPDNIELLCAHCNSSKGTKTKDEFIEYLARLATEVGSIRS